MLTLVCALCLVRVGAAKMIVLYEKHMLPKPDWPEGNLMLMTGEYLRTMRDFKASYQYPFADSYLWVRNGSNIRVFGVRTEGEARLTLHDVTGAHKPVTFTLGEQGKAGKYQCSAAYGKKTFPKPCESYHSRGQFRWYTLERTNNHMAVYRAGQKRPDAFINNIDVDKKINFNHYRTFSPSSKKSAHWDFQGVKVNEAELPRDVQTNPFLEVGLERVNKGHLKHQRFEWHCEWGRQQKDAGISDQLISMKVNCFVQKFCKKSEMVPYLDALKRHRAILLVNGIPPHTRDKYDDSTKFFDNKWA